MRDGRSYTKDALRLAAFAGYNANEVDSLFDAAFNGDADAAHELVAAAPNAMRGHAVRTLYEAGVRGEALRLAIDKAWNHDPSHLLSAIGTWPRFVRMFRAAKFKAPNTMRSPVTIWRGTTRAAFDAKVGISWTLNRDVACWFAMRWCRDQPLVIRATCPRRSIMFYTDARNEAEVIPETLPWGVSVDGDESDWQQGTDRYEAAKRARREARMQAIREGHGAA